MSVAHEAQFLDELLAQMNLRARIAFRGLACERWAIGGSRQGRLSFHAVLSGRCWVRLPNAATPVELTAGGLLIYRPDIQTLLADTPYTERELSPARILPVSSTAVGPHVGLLCGYFEGGGASTPIVDALPRYLVWPNFEAYPEPLARLVRALTACALDETHCGQQILQRLCELVILMVLREPTVLKVEQIGILCAQRDPKLRRVLDAIHARPGRQWTLTSLARSAGISRSAFSARFTQLAGISAMHYVRRYRVALAERRMREEKISVKQAARACGYRSVGAFVRAARRC
jgi:AraC family transcriptional regulator, activator of mtrCDE